MGYKIEFDSDDEVIADFLSSYGREDDTVEGSLVAAIRAQEPKPARPVGTMLFEAVDTLWNSLPSYVQTDFMMNHTEEYWLLVDVARRHYRGIS
jgi:hypothetical protein